MDKLKLALFGTLIAAALVAVGMFIGKRQSKPWESFRREGGTGGGPLVVANGVFQDTDQGKELNDSLKATAGQLAKAKNVAVEAGLNEKVVIYADVFDAYTRDLRTTVEANYKGYVTALSQATTPDERKEYKRGQDQILQDASARTAQIRALKALVDSYTAQPTKEGMVEIGKSVRQILSDSRTAKQSSLPPEIVPDGLSRLLDEIHGNRAASGMWDYKTNDAASVTVNLKPSRESDVTPDIDLTPFMQRNRNATVTLNNVDSAGRQAFACCVKSHARGKTLPWAVDGFRQVDNSMVVHDGASLLIAKAEDGDTDYYLAWRGNTMTKEEFARRYPQAEVTIALTP